MSKGKSRRPKNLVTAEVVATYKKMRAKGYTLSAISEHLGCTNGTTHYHLSKDNGTLARPKRDRKAELLRRNAKQEMITLPVEEDTNATTIAAIVGTPTQVAAALKEMMQ